MNASALSNEESSALLQAIQELSYPRPLDVLMNGVATAARSLIGSDGVTFVLREGTSVFYADEVAIAPLWKGRRFDASACISGWAILHRESVVIEDIDVDARIPLDLYRATFVRSLAMVPIRKDDPIGAIGAYWAHAHRASAKELFILETLANAAAGAVMNLELQRGLRDANQAKDEFLAMLGHELRNPLAPIVTALHLLELRHAEDNRATLAIVQRQVRHLVRLVDDLLDVSRIARGKVELKREPVSIQHVVAKAVEMVRPLLEQRRHHLDVTVPGEALTVVGDGTRLAQVVANLLTNAAKYTDAEGHIAVSAARVGSNVVLRVRDDGMGIDAKTLPSIFELFVQDRQPLDRAQGGLGLGLALVRALVTGHGGTVEAHSDGPGRGAELTVTLPLRIGDSLVPTSDAPRDTPRPASRRARVLIVDDNADAADTLEDAIRMAGHETRVAHDGPTSLEIARDFRPEIALLDIGLPVMDGYELAGRLRHLLSGERIRVFAVTGYGQESDRERSRSAGFDLHFVKPIDLRVVLGALDEAVVSG